MTQKLTAMIGANERVEISGNQRQAWETALLAEERDRQREAIRSDFLRLVGQQDGTSETVVLSRAELGKLAGAFVEKVEALQELHAEHRAARQHFELALESTAVGAVTEAIRVLSRSDQIAEAVHRAVSKALAVPPLTTDASATIIAEARANAARFARADGTKAKETANG